MRKSFRNNMIKMIVFSLILASLSTALNSSGLTYKINCYPSEAPKIDGNVNEEEWSGGRKEEIKLMDPWLVLPGGAYVEIDVLALYSSDSFLYLGVIVHKWAGENCELQIYFHTNTDEDFLGGFNPTEGNDAQVIDGYANCSFDCKNIDPNSANNLMNDTILGGTNDTIGRCHFGDNIIMFELMIPFDSGDYMGGDMSIGIGDTINAYIEYNQYRLSNENGCYITIKEDAAAPLSSIGIFVGIIAVAIITKRRKKVES